MKIAALSSVNPFRANNTKQKEHKGELAAPPVCETSAPYFGKLYSKDYLIQNNNVSFKGFDCSPSSFDVKKAYGIECPCCGQVMLTKKQLSKHIARMVDKTGESLREALQRELDYCRPQEAEIVTMLLAASESNPDLDLKGLVGLKAEESLLELENTQKSILEEMRQESESLPEKTKREVYEHLCMAKEAIYNSDENQYFKRKEFVRDIQKLKKSHKKDREVDTILCFDRLIELAEDMPTSHTSKDAFFVKYARRENREIADRLLRPATVTTEHIRPQSKDGANNTDNYIPMCGDCNSKRGNTPYSEWFEDHPEMKENLQNYINKIAFMINNNEIDRSEYYDTYVDDVISAIYEATDGELLLQKPEDPEEIGHEPEMEEIPPAHELTDDEKREMLMAQFTEKQDRLHELYALRDELEGDEEFQNIVQYKRTNEELKAVTAARKQKRTDYLSKKARLRTAEENLDAAQSKRDYRTIKVCRERRNTLTKECEEARIAFEPVDERYRALSARFETLKGIVTTPEEMQTKISIAKNKLLKTKNAGALVARLTAEMADEDDVIISLAKINGEIGEAKETGDSERVKKLQAEKAGLEARSKELRQMKAELKSARSKYKYLRAGKSEKTLSDELEALIQRKAEITKKFRNVNISSAIKKLEEECDALLQAYAESYEYFCYQHSKPKVGKSSSSSS